MLYNYLKLIFLLFKKIFFFFFFLFDLKYFEFVSFLLLPPNCCLTLGCFEKRETKTTQNTERQNNTLVSDYSLDFLWFVVTNKW